MWIIITWQCVSPEVTAKGFKKCCISIAMDETDVMSNSSAEVGNIRSECEEDEGTDCDVAEIDTDW
jgi:hypothetical protein